MTSSDQFFVGPVESIRLATADDIDDLVSLYRLWLDEQEVSKGRWAAHEGWQTPVDDKVSASIASPSECVLIGMLDQVPVGFAIGALLAGPGDDPNLLTGQIRSIYVRPEARELGVGALLLAGTTTWADAHGAREAEMRVLPGHRAAKNFCEENGLTARLLIMSGGWGPEGPIGDAPVEISSELEALPWVAEAGVIPAGPVDQERPPRSASVPCVGAFVVEREELLLVRRGHAPSAGDWSVPGGRLEPGETLEAGAAREVLEETGIEVEIDAFLGVADRPGFVICDFLAHPVGGTQRARSDASEVGWFRLDQLPRNLVPGLRDFIELADISGVPRAVYHRSEGEYD